MIYLKNISVKKKLLSITILLLIITIFHLVFSLLKIQEHEEKLTILAEIHVFQQAIAEFELANIQLANTLPLYSEKITSKSLSNKNATFSSDFTSWYTSAKKDNALILFPSVAPDIEATLALVSQLHTSAEQIKALAATGDVDGARTFFSTDFLPAQEKVKNFLANIQHIIDNETQSIALALASYSNQMRTSALLSGVLVCIVLLVFFIDIQYTVLNPLGKIRAYAEKGLKGEDASLDFTSKSEIGTLADTFRHLFGSLNRERAFLHGIMNGIPFPCALFSPQDITIFTNQKMLDILELDGKPEDMYTLTSGEYLFKDKSKETFSTVAIREHKAVSTQSTWKGFKGTERDIIIDTAPFYNYSGELLGILTIWSDITEMVRSQRQIEETIFCVNQVAEETQTVSEGVFSAVAEVFSKIEQSKSGATFQYEKLTEAAASITEIHQMAVDTAQSISRVTETTVEAKNSAQDGFSVVEQVIDSMNSVEEHAGSAKEEIELLGKEATEINSVITIIRDIADQTNLLALNAAIEAARAGEFGKGFSVVASEVRKLAEKTMQATQQVDAAIVGIQKRSVKATETVETSVDAIEKAMELAQSAGEKLASIVTLASKVATEVESISMAVEQQSTSTDTVSQMVLEVKHTAEDTSTAMVEATNSVEIVSDQAEVLKEMISAIAS